MPDILLQTFGLVLLIVGLWWGYRRWIKPYATTLDVRGNGLLVLVTLTFMGGFIGSPFWWLDEARSFPWDLPPLASRMLAAAGWSFAVVAFLALQRPNWRRLRLVLLLLATYLTPLVLAILLFHLDRFDFSAPITYAFLLIAVAMLATTIWYLLRQPVIIAHEPRDFASTSAVTRGWLGLTAVIAALWGVALFVTDNGPSPLIWAWPGDLLTSRLIGTMLLAITVGAVMSMRHTAIARVMLWVTLAYGLGVALASFWNSLAGKPIKLSYFVAFGLIFLGSAVLLLTDRPATSQPSVPET